MTLTREQEDRLRVILRGLRSGPLRPGDPLIDLILASDLPQRLRALIGAELAKLAEREATMPAKRQAEDAAITADKRLLEETQTALDREATPGVESPITEAAPAAEGNSQ